MKKTYRVRQEINGNNTSLYLPQERYLFFFWKQIMEEGRPGTQEEFYNLEDAEKFLYNRTVKDNSKVITKKINHNFNAVFHKLKQE